MTRVLVTPITHPAAILRGNWELEPAQPVYLTDVFTHLRQGTVPEVPDVNLPPPGTKLFPTVGDIEQLVAEAQRLGAVAIDIENAGRFLICVGLTALSLETGEIGATVCVRFRLKRGVQFWTREADLRQVIESFDQLLGDPAVAKVFHNGVTHDVPILEDHGWVVAGRLVDTMLLAHLAYSEFPKSLQWTSTLYLRMPRWKHLVDSDDEDDGKN